MAPDIHMPKTKTKSVSPKVSMDRGSPTLMRRINIRQLLDAMRVLGPCSRVDLTRHTGLSAPTVSKVMKELLLRQLVETLSTPKQPSTGRPSTIYQLARKKIQFLGLVIDIEQCRVVSAGLDGKEDLERTRVFETPKSYADLITTVSRHLQQVAAEKEGAEVLGVGISVPGLIDESEGRQVFSPNVHYMNGCYPAQDIADATGYITHVVQEEKGEEFLMVSEVKPKFKVPLPPKPKMPTYIARARVDVTTVIEFFVTSSGDVDPRTKIVVSSGYPELDEIAVEWAKKIKFFPALNRGEPVAVRVRVPVGWQSK